MAEERRQDQPKSIEELRQEISHTRDRLGRDLTGLRYEFDFPLKLRKSFQRHSGIWISAATLLGTLFTMRPSGKKKTLTLKAGKSGQAKKGEEQKKGLMAAGLAMGGLRLLATLLRPMVVAFLTKKVRGYSGATK
ncbi:MAG: hypothetical protein M3505_01395 [Verrucomicrobiota bacterium]|jgi:hypothetical protein|nr:hypothetical protein [Chthoniobacterales bacterium]MBA3762490.1 hypothetical protein [Chthoniobacterales bacterium]MDQ3313284.1 hypothetical protein [Verrucomicrobiota bacterium]